MTKYKVVGDPENPKMFSSEIIISSLNNAAKSQDLYSENDAVIVYDCCGKNHNFKNASAIICCYEHSVPKYVVRNLNGLPTIAVSPDNMMFLLEGGIPKDKVSYINLGVNSQKFKLVEKKKNLDKFVVLSYTESLVRSGLNILIEGFGQAFSGDKSAVLYIKDRNARPEFYSWLKFRADYYNIELVYENRHISNIEEILDMFSGVDVHFNLNFSTTWGMCILESMSAGIVTAASMYSGPRQFILDKMTGIGIEYELEGITQEKINQLESIGMRNFFFPINKENFNSWPYWCQPKVESVYKNLISIRNNLLLRKKISFLGRKMAEELSWEKSALSLSRVLMNFN